MSAEAPQHDAAAVAGFARRMWQNDLIFSVPRADIAACKVPMLVLPGVDDYHPPSVGEELARIAPAATVLRGWKDSPGQITAALLAIRQYLRAHAR